MQRPQLVERGDDAVAQRRRPRAAGCRSSTCSASTVPIRTSTDGSSRRTSSGVVLVVAGARAISGTTVLPKRASAPAASSLSSARPSASISASMVSSRTSDARRLDRLAAPTSASGSRDERRQQVGERVRHERDQPRGLGPLARAFAAPTLRPSPRASRARRRGSAPARARRGTRPCRRGSRSPRSRRASRSARADRCPCSRDR